MQWVDVLNRSTSWSDFDAAARLAAAAGQPLPAAAHARVVADTALLWRLFAAHHLRGDLAEADHRALLQWLEAVTLDATSTLTPGPKAATGLRAARRRQGLPEPFESALTGALLQLLATVGEPEVFGAVRRCHGVQRRDSVALLTPEIEARFARQAGVDRLLVPSEEVSQCAHLFVAARGRQFCSKSCSNATFAARKALEDPQYFAAKQERYRLRQRADTEAAPRERPGAFVYID